MTKQVTVEELREKLDEVLANVKSGEAVTIIDAGKTIAEMRPTIVQRGVRFPFRNLKITPLKGHSASILIESESLHSKRRTIEQSWPN